MSWRLTTRADWAPASAAAMSRHGPHPPTPSRHLDARSGAVRARDGQARSRRVHVDQTAGAASPADARGRAGRLAVDGPTRRPPAPRPDLVLVGRRATWSCSASPTPSRSRNLRANPRLMFALGRPERGLLRRPDRGRGDARGRPRGRPRRVLRQVRGPAAGRRPRPRDVPRDVHAGDPDRPDPLPRLARARRAARAPGAPQPAVRAAAVERPARGLPARGTLLARLGLIARWPTAIRRWQSGRSGSHGGSGDGRDREDAGWRRRLERAPATSPARSAASWAAKAGSQGLVDQLSRAASSTR